ncbi:MAG: hypothetical protein ABJA98_09235 [Acidobacteriota bacterium]
MPEEATRTSRTDTEPAISLRAVLDLLLQDMHKAVDPATLSWDRPIFVLRSANMGRLQALLEEIVLRCPAPALHVMSHARDEEALRQAAPCALTFHAYPTAGRYRLEDVPVAVLDRLRAVPFGILFYLDTGPYDDLFNEVERLLGAISSIDITRFCNDDTYAGSSHRRLRQRAEAAFLGLIEWYRPMPGTEASDRPMRQGPRL